MFMDTEEFHREKVPQIGADETIYGSSESYSWISQFVKNHFNLLVFIVQFF